jgi:hypothetical protein
MNVLYQEIIEDADKLAEEAHKNQYRWSGRSKTGDKIPYITHANAVQAKTKAYLAELGSHVSDEEKMVYLIVAKNHDHKEDHSEHYNNVFLPYLESVKKKHVFLENAINSIIEAIEAISKKEKGLEEYIDYVLRVKSNVYASVVKIFDLQHNMSDLDAGSLRDKYSLTLWVLTNT